MKLGLSASIGVIREQVSDEKNSICAQRVLAFKDFRPFLQTEVFVGREPARALGSHQRAPASGLPTWITNEFEDTS
jgi:hypothetical protein